MKQLLQHFKDLTLHPKNAEELKGLILQLAIQGKLTAQWRKVNPDVVSAKQLLENLKAEKTALIKEKKIKKEKPLDPIEGNELKGGIPFNWMQARLGEVGDWGAGATPSRSRSDFYGGDVNWFKSGELNNGIMDYNSKETINELAIQNSSLRLNKIGDVLIAMYGATIGKTGILAVEGATNQAVCACTPFSCISNVYLHLLLKSLKDTFINQGEGGAQPNISRVKIRNQVFALPPLEEQKAIVATVNQLFAEVEQLEDLTKQRIQLKEDFVTSALRELCTQDTISAWGFLHAHFKSFFTEKSSVKKLRESILQLAVQGKLTNHWRTENPNTEDASVLLERIKAEKEALIKANKIKKEKPLTAITEDEIPYDLPEGWVWCRLGDVTTIKGGKRLPQGHALIREDTGRVYIRVTDMKNGSIDDSNLHYISEEVYKQISNYIIEKEDLYLTIVGATIGKLGLIPEKFHKMNLTENAARIIKYEIEKELLYYFMISSFVQNQFFDKTNQVGVPKLALHRVAKTLLPLPPVEEQQAIVSKVNALMALCDSLENEIETHQTTQEHWMQSCLKEVFLPAEGTKVDEGV